MRPHHLCDRGEHAFFGFGRNGTTRMKCQILCDQYAFAITRKLRSSAIEGITARRFAAPHGMGFGTRVHAFCRECRVDERDRRWFGRGRRRGLCGASQAENRGGCQTG